jgi:hypothetical protein
MLKRHRIQGAAAIVAANSNGNQYGTTTAERFGGFTGGGVTSAN